MHRSHGGAIRKHKPSASARKPERIDLLMTDVVMPTMGGRELVRRLAEIQPGLRVLFSSGYPGDSEGEQGMLDHGASFLQKPYTPKELAERIREVLDE
jgi:two-component system cell cycle sensor histidine kinase/response regulator CckA